MAGPGRPQADTSAIVAAASATRDQWFRFAVTDRGLATHPGAADVVGRSAPYEAGGGLFRASRPA
ncbi:hypothetical protein [Streptomyces sp. NPDC054765]